VFACRFAWPATARLRGRRDHIAFPTLANVQQRTCCFTAAGVLCVGPASDTQVANCKSALGLYGERMAVVLAERRSLAAHMSSCLTSLQLEEAGGRAGPGSIRREELTLEAEEAATALDANVAMEGHTTSLARVGYKRLG
jgi:hypothetical protein